MEIAIVNYLAILISAVVSFVIGGLWYGPIFGKMWIALMGFTQKDIDKAKQKGMSKSYLITFVASLIMAFVLAHFIIYTGASNFFEGFQVGFWVWLGFVATTQLGTVLWENKSWNLFILNIAYWLVNLLVMGAILAVWQ